MNVSGAERRLLRLPAALVDELHAVAVRVADEAEERTSLAYAVRLPLRLDALLLQPLERPAEVVDADGDVPVAGAEVVRTTVVVQRQLELLVLAREPEEVVRRLLLAAADDVHVATKLHPERLVEGAA